MASVDVSERHVDLGGDCGLLGNREDRSFTIIEKASTRVANANHNKTFWLGERVLHRSKANFA